MSRIADRAHRVRERLTGAEALLVSDLTNVRWLTGFTGSNGWVVLGPDGSHARHRRPLRRSRPRTRWPRPASRATSWSVPPAAATLEHIAALLRAVRVRRLRGRARHVRRSTASTARPCSRRPGAHHRPGRGRAAREGRRRDRGDGARRAASPTRRSPRWRPRSATASPRRRCATGSRCACASSAPAAPATTPSWPPAPPTPRCRTTGPPTRSSSPATPSSSMSARSSTATTAT